MVHSVQNFRKDFLFKLCMWAFQKILPIPSNLLMTTSEMWCWSGFWKQGQSSRTVSVDYAL